MSYELGKAYIQIVPTTKNFKQALSGEIDSDAEKAGEEGGEKSGKKFSSAFATAAKVGAAAVSAIGAAAVALGKQVLTSYSEYEQLAGGAELLWGDAYESVMESAKNAYATVQMSASDYLEQVNGLSTGLKTALNGDSQAAAELAGKVVTAEADVVAATGASQEAVQNAFNGIMKSNYTMLDNLQLGITPTKEGFQEVIDKVNEWNEANGEATSYQIDNLADCQAALVDYIEMQGLAGYAAEEGTSTISGSISSLSAAWENLITGLGDSNADIELLVNNVISSFNSVLGNCTPIIENIIAALPMAVTTALQAIVNMLPTILQTVVGLFQSVLQMLITCLPDLIPVAVDAILMIVNTLLENLPMIIDAAFQIVVAIINGIAEALPDMVPTIIDVVLTVVDTIIENLPLLLDAALAVIVALATGIIESLPELCQRLPEIINAITSTLIGMIDQIIDAGIQLLVALVSNMPAIVAGIVKAIPTIITGIVSAVGQGVGQMMTAGVNLLEGLWQGISNAAGWLWNKITGWLNGLWSGIKSFFGIHSPSTEMAWIGDMLCEGLAGGIDDNADAAVKSAVNMSDEVLGAVNSISAGVGDIAVSTTGSLPQLSGELTSAANYNEQVELVSGSRIDVLIDLLSKYLPGIADQGIYLDTGALVGGTVNKMNEALGTLSVRASRGMA